MLTFPLEDALAELQPLPVIEFRKTQCQVGVHDQAAVGIEQHEESAQHGPQGKLQAVGQQVQQPDQRHSQPRWPETRCKKVWL